MSFCSVTFLFKFLPASLALYYIAPQKLKNFAMLAASLFFYAWGAPVYIVLLMLVIVLDFFCGLDIAEKKEEPALAKRSLIFAVFANVLLLVFFKYHSPFMEALNSLLPWDIPYRRLPFPMGVSFYTLQALSYLTDIYRGKAKPQKNFINLALYISMFPQIIAGPIVRYDDIEGQLNARKMSARKFGAGAQKFITGLAKRAIIANGMRQVFDEVIKIRPGGISALTAWTGCISFAFCIYFDFSGYSDMAEGLAKMFGFDFRRNFYYPYVSSGVTGFWRRWNISLAKWFRRYVYKPLGGDSYGKARDIRNLLVVWALTGLWHGGGANFLFWGLYHGLLLVMEKYVFKDLRKRMSPGVRRFCTFMLVTAGWVFFFSPRAGLAFGYLGAMFGIGAAGVIDARGLFLISSNWLLYILAVMASSPALRRIFKKIYLSFKSPKAQKIAAAALYICCFMVSLAFLSADLYDPFLSFGF